MKQRLTVRTVEAIPVADRDTIVWDLDLTGFGVKVTPKGKRSYFLYYRTKDGQARRPTIGAHGSIKPEAARDIAKGWLLQVAGGHDPSLQRSESRTAPTVQQLGERYLSDHAERKKKPSSINNDRRMIEKRISPELGTRKVAAITRSEIVALHGRLRGTPYEANRVLALLSKMFQLAERWGLRPDGSNPARNIDRFPEPQRTRFLTDREVVRLLEVLGSDDVITTTSASALAAIKLLLLTGRRLNEILKLRWDWVDLEQRALNLPDTKTGALTAHFGRGALAILIELRKRWPDSDFVIPGKLGDRSLVNLQKPWRKVRKLAGLEDVRLHDLRHTFASMGASQGQSHPLLMRLMGHSNPKTTERYIHFDHGPIRTAVDRIDRAFTDLGAASLQ